MDQEDTPAAQEQAPQVLGYEATELKPTHLHITITNKDQKCQLYSDLEPLPEAGQTNCYSHLMAVRLALPVALM